MASKHFLAAEALLCSGPPVDSLLLGYIQPRPIKSMESVMVKYDATVRNHCLWCSCAYGEMARRARVSNSRIWPPPVPSNKAFEKK